jgi:hypothetical protein
MEFELDSGAVIWNTTVSVGLLARRGSDPQTPWRTAH